MATLLRISPDDAFFHAVENIARYGDTDVLPYPIENHVLYDKPAEVVSLLKQMEANFAGSMNDFPPITAGMLSTVGYTGFRWATQIDPIWNAFFLGLVIQLGSAIEAARLPIDRNAVFSYRFKWDGQNKTLFDRTVGWVQFQEQSVQHARKYRYVLSCDIADFYPRIYHHRLENALHKATATAHQCDMLMRLLVAFSNNVSYGLPVGGPASRLLSELLLNRVDRLLVTTNITFCRFADDYHIFADSQEEAYRHLVFLSEKLMANEGLLLQKAKTRIMSSEEFLGTSEFAIENAPESESEKESREFLRLRLHFDPYSQTAKEDYEALQGEIVRFDVLGMLGREIRKSRIHQSLTKKLIGAVRLLAPASRDTAILTLMENVRTLYPVFASVMQLIKATIDELAPRTRELVLQKLRELLRTESYVTQVPMHLAYVVRVLAHDTSDEADEILARVYLRTESHTIRRDVILAMAKRNADFWVSDIRRNFMTLNEWERTSLIVASYMLGDEGKHWRGSIRKRLTPMQELVLRWADERAKAGVAEVPI